MIYCARCETYKPESEYYASINRSWCKPCRVEYSKAKYANLSPEEKADLLRVTAEKRRIRNQRLNREVHRLSFALAHHLSVSRWAEPSISTKAVLDPTRIMSSIPALYKEVSKHWVGLGQSVN